MSDDNLVAENQEDPGLPRRWSVILLAVGIAAGAATHFFIDLNDDLAWQMGPTLGLLAGALAFCLTVVPARWLYGTLGAVVLALLLGTLATTGILRFGTPVTSSGSFFFSFAVVIEALIVAKIAVPFLQTWQEQGRLHFPYPRLFAHAWNNALIAALSAGFTGLFWIILWLFALLFRYVGFVHLEELIEEPAFAWPATCGAAALGIYAGRDYRRIVVSLRRVVFSLFSLLTPLFLVLAFGFLVALSLGGFTKLAYALSASSTLIALLIIGVVLFNALLRDGTRETETGKFLGTCARLMPLALIGLCIYAAYAIYLRIDQYGLTPERIWIAVTVAVLSLHSLAYLASLVTGSRWMTVSRQANIAIAGVVAVVALALLTPLADPYRLSAESQYRRLASGAADPATFDYGFLKFDAGKAGAEVLERIARDSGAADPQVVAERLAVLAKAERPWEWHSASAGEPQRSAAAEAMADPERIRRIPADLQLPETFIPEWLNYIVGECGAEDGRECLVTPLDMTDTPGDELLLATRRSDVGISLHLLERAPEGDAWVGTFLRIDAEDRAIWQALENGNFAAVPADHQDLKVGDTVIRLREGPIPNLRMDAARVMKPD